MRLIFFDRSAFSNLPMSRTGPIVLGSTPRIAAHLACSSLKLGRSSRFTNQHFSRSA